jgi:CheY-like chemotaxis protein
MSPQPLVESSGAGKCILVVDDEIECRYLLAERLRTVGFVVHEASNADEAATLLKSHMAFDAVVTDIQMPGDMDGIMLADSIRASSPAILVVVVSGLNMSGQLERKGTKFFQKPYASEALIDYLKKNPGPQ